MYLFSMYDVFVCARARLEICLVSFSSSHFTFCKFHSARQLRKKKHTCLDSRFLFWFLTLLFHSTCGLLIAKKKNQNKNEEETKKKTVGILAICMCIALTEPHTRNIIR